MMECIVDNRGDRYWLLKIPGDGDCLFGSIVHQVYGVTPKHPMFKTHSHQARLTAVDEIRSHLPYYYDQIACHANDEFPADCSIEDKVEWYLAKLESSGFWGGEESIAALANRYQVIFTIHQDGSKIEFRPANSETELLPRYNLFYRNLVSGTKRRVNHGLPARRTHYDSVLCVREGRVNENGIIGGSVQDLPSFSYPIRVKWFENSHVALVRSVIHQLTGLDPSQETVNVFCGLIADEIDHRSSSFLPSCGVQCESPEEISNFSCRLREGCHDGGFVTLVVLADLLDLTVFLHSTQQDSSIRFEPSVSRRRSVGSNGSHSGGLESRVAVLREYFFCS